MNNQRYMRTLYSFSPIDKRGPASDNRGKEKGCAAMEKCITEFFAESPLNPAWANLLKAEWEKPYFEKLCRGINDARAGKTVFPPAPDVFAALNLTATCAA